MTYHYHYHTLDHDIPLQHLAPWRTTTTPWTMTCNYHTLDHDILQQLHHNILLLIPHPGRWPSIATTISCIMTFFHHSYTLHHDILLPLLSLQVPWHTTATPWTMVCYKMTCYCHDHKWKLQHDKLPCLPHPQPAPRNTMTTIGPFIM